MSGYINIEKVILPEHCINEAYNHMRKAGERRIEGVALFAGKENRNIFKVEKTIIPKQHALSLENGLLYAVDSDELHRINVWLYENKLSLMIQIHSHPSEAYHSDTDDKFPIIATVGGLSIVVPKFANGPINMNTWAVYRLLHESGWTKLNEKEKQSLFELTT